MCQKSSAKQGCPYCTVRSKEYETQFMSFAERAGSEGQVIDTVAVDPFMCTLDAVFGDPFWESSSDKSQHSDYQRYSIPIRFCPMCGKSLYGKQED